MCRVFEVFNVYSTVIYIIVSIFIVLSESSGLWASTSNSFIFSLRNKEGLGAFKRLVSYPSRAVYWRLGYGPTFGEGHDIYIANNANSTQNSYTLLGHSYPFPSGVQDSNTILAGTHYFTPDDWEVFYLAY